MSVLENRKHVMKFEQNTDDVSPGDCAVRMAEAGE